MSATNDGLDVFNLAARDLPAGWSIFIHCEMGAVSVRLVDPHGGEVYMHEDEVGIEEQILNAIKQARTAGGKDLP